MERLYQKVCETMKKNHHHSADDVYGVVNVMLIKLRERYVKETSKHKIQASYISTIYKSFFVSTQNDKSPKDCLLEESNISNFIKGETKNIRDKSKDFFAVYCGYEGYYDFISKPSPECTEEKFEGKKQEILFTVNQFGTENTNIGEIKTDNLYL